jgi:protein-L-isoaspartate(D-aspartate) O-methyltransferase
VTPALVGVLTGVLLTGACSVGVGVEQEAPVRTGAVQATGDRADERARMVRTQIEARGVKDPRVLAAMRAVPRHLFVLPAFADRAYDDSALPIAEGQTISQPYIVAVMTEAAQVEPDDVVLEVGTGSGYQAAVLSHLVAHVYSIEIVPGLARSASALLARDGYANVTVREGDGYAGWPEHAPFDAILVTAAPPEIPAALREQLKVGGRMVVPVGEYDQYLRVITRTADGFDETTLMPVRFVPMVRPR